MIADERVHRPRSRMVSFSPFNPVYPGPGCKGGAACAVCPRWRCPGCFMLRPWCFGCTDDKPELCDSCCYTGRAVPRGTK